ncbi:VCBS domain-containing protein [Vibrio algivorus]|uniref:Cadherin domain-containing protein n=1 Tax=Vibrio algivorus TaxID=1667024 RepID=A0A557NZY4_9VIBR|nr:VCBS domain-containing protein [Vibrio algivorus]TVO33960.1 hypothetical protein FOF44_14400 [Vibrio algivorus]
MKAEKSPGTNDIPVFTAIPSISVTEDAAMVTGHLQANDFDTGANQHLTYTASQAVDGFTLNSDGSWSFDPSHASYQHLAKGVSETISIPVSVTDGEGGTSHSTLTIDITGTNDHPYLLGTDSYTLDESDNIASGQLHALDADDGDTVTLSLDPAQPQVAGFTFDPTDGSYTFDPSDPAYNYLAAGEKLDIVIPITCTDSFGESRTQTHAITFHLTGTNDAAIITGTDSGSITEDLNINAAAVSNTLSAHGHLDVADADTGEAHFQSQIDIKGDHGFGSFMILEQGEWMYIADNDNPEIQKLSAGETRTDSVTVHSADGTPHKITVTIHGADESGVPTVVHESAQGGVHLASTVDATQPVEHIMALADFGLTSTDKGTTITLVTAPAHDGSNKDDGGQFVLQDAQGHETPIHDKGSFTYDDVLAGRVIYQQFDLKSHDVKYTISGDPREHELAFTPPSSTSHDVPDTTETSSFTATLDSTDAPADHPASSHEGISDAASLYMDLLQPKHHVTEDKHTLNDHSQPQHLVVENVDDSMVHNPQHNADDAHGHVNTPVDSYLKMVGANHADKAEVKAEHDASLLDQKFDHNPLADHVHDVLAHEGLDHFANPLADEAHDKHDKHAVFDDHGGKGMEHGMDSPQVDDQLIDGNHHSPDQYNH